MSLRDALLGKARRRIVVPVQVTDPGRDDEEVAKLRQLVAVAPLLKDRTEADQALLVEELAAAETRAAAHVVEVELQALSDADYELVVSRFPGPDPARDGGMDWRAALPVLLAASCVDEDLRDDIAWWQQLLTGDAWSHGDLLTLWGAVLRVNTRAPAAHLGKG